MAMESRTASADSGDAVAAKCSCNCLQPAVQGPRVSQPEPQQAGAGNSGVLTRAEPQLIHR